MFSKPSRSLQLLTMLSLAAAMAPSSLRAQAATDAPRIQVTAPDPSSTFGPRVAPAAFAWSVQPAPPEVVAPQSRPNAGADVAMMGAGGAAVVVGSLVGGDGGMMIALTGGVVGLIGLYRYLR